MQDLLMILKAQEAAPQIFELEELRLAIVFLLPEEEEELADGQVAPAELVAEPQEQMELQDKAVAVVAVLKVPEVQAEL